MAINTPRKAKVNVTIYMNNDLICLKHSLNMNLFKTQSYWIDSEGLGYSTWPLLR